MRICIYGAASPEISQDYLLAGEAFGELMAQNGHALVFGGGAHGMMGAVARGCHRYGGEIVGIAPRFFQVDGVLFPHCTEMIYTDTMRARKQIMEDRSDGFLTLPGGIGTFEEFFEILTLRQLGQLQKPVAIWNLFGYYDPLCALLSQAISNKFLPKENLSLFYLADTAQQALSYLQAPHDFDGKMQDYRYIKGSAL